MDGNVDERTNVHVLYLRRRHVSQTPRAVCQTMPSVMSVDPPAPLHKTETFQGVDRNDFAYKMVQKMGWAEGEGLGREKSGITKHIWTKKRADAVGIGAESTNDWGAHSVQTNTFNQLLAKLDVIVNNSDDEDEEKDVQKKTQGKKGKRKGLSKKEKDESSESESEASEDDKSKKQRKNGKKKGSKATTDKEDKKRKRKAESGSSDSDSSDDSDLEKNAASTSTEDYVGRKAGRSFAAAAVMKQRYAYKRSFMRNSKDVKSYSSEDLSQILGFSVPPKEEDTKVIAKNAIKQHAKKVTASSSDSAESDSDKSEKTKKKKDKKGKKEKKSLGKAESEDDAAAEAPAAPHEPSELTSNILKGLFVYGGLLTGLKEKKEQDWEFNEETQEKIATDAHASKVEARKGLGFSNDRPSKLGKDYEGKKIRFGEDDDEGEEAAKSRGDEESETKEEKKARKKEKKLKRERKEAEQEQEQEQEEESKKKKKKLKKAVSDVDDVERKSKKLKRSSSFP